ncbi:hypothetical protein BU16DRAFT_313838 [Lophium mytilinum]|uniref:Uncharacterized protein n=1 Tax=Lophium mytilinum TaxID=390894 RepID=A0A6A6QZJ1_9PEZI|nr:hypothetical protein BU16DRAFT_313838 [Lophium mytilinum]
MHRWRNFPSRRHLANSEPPAARPAQVADRVQALRLFKHRAPAPPTEDLRCVLLVKARAQCVSWVGYGMVLSVGGAIESAAECSSRAGDPFVDSCVPEPWKHWKCSGVLLDAAG